MASSRSLGQLTVDLIAKIGGFTAGMDQAARVAEDRSRRIDRTMRGLGRTITTVFAALGGAALVRQVVRATIEQENALRQLETRILSTGGAAGKTAGDLTAFANQLQKITTYEDDAIVAAQGLLLSFTNIRGAVFDRVTESALDLAAATGQDLPAAFRTLGIAVNDPVKGISRLTRAGIQLDESQVKLIKRLAETGQVTRAQGILLDEISKRFGGSARAAADTFGGSLLQLKNSFSNLFEAPGGVNDAKEALQEFTAILQDPETIAAAGRLTSAIITGFGGATKAIIGTVDVMRFIGEEMSAMINGIAADDLPRLEEELKRAERIRNESLLFSRTGLINRITLFGPKGWFEFWNDAELDQEIKDLRAAIAAAGGERVGGTSVSGIIDRSLSFPRTSQDVPVTEVPDLDFKDPKAMQEWLDRLAKGKLTLPVLLSPKIDLEELPDDLARAAQELQELAKHDRLELKLTPEIDLLDIETEMAKMDTTFKDFSESMGRGLHDTLVDAFLGVETSFGDLLKRMAAELLTSSLLKSFGSVFAGATGPWGKLAAGLFGGARAEGGPVTAGMSYLVGERGPEFFRPKVSGMVTAADGGGVTLYQTYHIDARGAESSLVNRLPSILEQQRRRGLADARDEMRRGRLR